MCNFDPFFIFGFSYNISSLVKQKLFLVILVLSVDLHINVQKIAFHSPKSAKRKKLLELKKSTLETANLVQRKDFETEIKKPFVRDKS